MAELQLLINDNVGAGLAAAANDAQLDGLYADEVVHEWLRSLEAEASATAQGALYLDAPRRMYA